MSGNVKLITPSNGSVTLSTPDTASAVTVTIPATTDTLVNLASTQTLSGKTLSSPTISGTATGGTYASATITAANGNTVEATSGPTSTQLAGMRNKIINGAMMIDQRNAGVSSTPANYAYLTDRWQFRASQGSKFTASQSTTAPAGFTNSLLFTSSSAYSVGSTDQFGVRQFIEGLNISDLAWGTANAQPITLSFWVRSSLTGTHSGALGNNGDARAYPFSFTVTNSNAWEQKTVVISGDTSGTWLTTNGIGIKVNFNLGAGSTMLATAGSWTTGEIVGATGSVSIVGTNGATFYITGVQLEKGATATPFENRLYGTELALCQRYYEKSYDIGTVPATITDNGCEVLRAPSSNPYQTVTYRVTKRAVPTFTTYNPTTGATGSWRDASGPANVATTVSFQGEKSAAVDVTTTTGYRIQGQWTASAEL